MGRSLDPHLISAFGPCLTQPFVCNPALIAHDLVATGNAGVKVLRLWVATTLGSNDPFLGVTLDHRKTQIFIPQLTTVAKLQL